MDPAAASKLTQRAQIFVARAILALMALVAWNVVTEGWGWYGQAAGAMAAAGAIVHWRRSMDLAQRTVPRVAAKAETLADLVAWLGEIKAGVPSTVAPAVQHIADHVSALEALRVEMPGAQLPLDQVRSLVGKDLRDLLVRWKRVETATKMLPGKQTLGVDALAGGFGRIECALVAIREDVASAALNDLKVSERYLELKHGEGV